MNVELLKAVLIHASLYGAYAILFTLSVYVHWKKRTSGLWIHLAFLSILFILATIAYIAMLDEIFRFLERMRSVEASFQSDTLPNIVEGVMVTFDQLQETFYENRVLHPLSGLKLNYETLWGFLNYHPPRPTLVVRICYILSNLVADVYITYRCYIVWGYSKKVVIFPVLLIIATLVFQIGPGKTFAIYKSEYGYTVAYFGGLAITLATNFFVTLLTAGRIWWMGRQANFLLQRRMQTKYDRTVQIVLESGLLYPITLLTTILMVLLSRDGKRLSSVIALNLCIVNIAPTLIIIRVGLGVSSDDIQTTIQTFKAAEIVQSEETVTDIQMRQSVAQA